MIYKTISFLPNNAQEYNTFCPIHSFEVNRTLGILEALDMCVVSSSVRHSSFLVGRIVIDIITCLKIHRNHALEIDSQQKVNLESF